MEPLTRMILRVLKVRKTNNFKKDKNSNMNIVAMQCIGEAFGVDADDEAQKKLYSTKPANLLSIFDVYLKTKSSATKVKFFIL